MKRILKSLGMPQKSSVFEFRVHVPVFYHGLCNCDAHHNFRYFNKHVSTMFDYKKHADDIDVDACLNVEIIALNLERFILFETLNLRFVDNVKFMNFSLGILVENSVKS